MKKSTKQEKIQSFLKDLTALSKKHGIFISSCGCGCAYCPVLEDTKLDRIGSSLEWYFKDAVSNSFLNGEYIVKIDFNEKNN